jgi:hypothetical protein
MKTIVSTMFVMCVVSGVAACAPQTPPATPTPNTTSSAATPSQAATAPPKSTLDANAIAQITGAKADVAGNVVKVGFPRNDVPVDVDGWQKMPPFMGLTSWAAFEPGEKPNVEAMVMGDLVLFEDEVNDTMSAALNHGLEVTALHNHFFFDKPHVLFMHISGEGKTDDLAKAVAATLDAGKQVRKKSPQPQTAFGAPPPSPSKIDASKLDAVLGIKGDAKDGMYKATMGRSAKAACGCAIGKVMGVNTWAAFGGTDDDAVVDGDFAVTESELQPVLKALRGGGINIVAIHSHMTGESPRILFLHYWGRGPSTALAQTVKRAVDLTAWDRPQPQ